MTRTEPSLFDAGMFIEPPSAIALLQSRFDAAISMLQLAEDHSLAARRIHDARHAAIAVNAGISRVYTYDAGDWSRFESAGLRIVGPSSVLEPPIGSGENSG